MHSSYAPRLILILLAVGGSLGSGWTFGQPHCQPQTTWHLLGDECLGGALVQCPEAITQVVWSTGDVGLGVDGLAPGTYSCTSYVGSTPIDTFTFTVERVQWVWVQYGRIPMGFGSAITCWPEVSEYCDTPVFNRLCCYPDAAQTFVDLIQDGSAVIASQAYVQCFGGAHLFPDVPPGHSYTLRVRDLHCDQVLEMSDPIVVNNCDSLALDLGVTGTEADAHNGSIVLVQARAESSGPYPLPAGPIPGEIWLFSGLSGWEEAGTSYPMGTTSASWTGLDPGYYRVQFRPDAGCNFITDTVYVPLQTSTGLVLPKPVPPELSIGPTCVQEELFIRGPSTGAVQVRLFDAAGRVVSRAAITGDRYPVDGLVPGLYVVEAERNGRMVRQRILKQ